MSQQFNDLVALLKELFQLDQPDLDFGIYRVLHARSAEITSFLEKDLLPQVRSAFDEYRPADKAAIERELGEATTQLRGLGVDPDTSSKVQDLRRRLTETAVDVGALEREVYEHLLAFFRRYYSEGDFLSRRVYKKDVYAVPYEGEEVKLHWANADQYYVKTSETVRDYAFRLRPDNLAHPMRVRFRLTDAAEGEHDNVKAAEGKERVFVLAGRDPVAEVTGPDGPELELRFEFRPATLGDWPEGERAGRPKPPGRAELVTVAERTVLAANEPPRLSWRLG